MAIDRHYIIEQLNLEPHPLEGGYFRRTYTSPGKYRDEGVQRNLASSIYYMLTSDSPIGFLHKNRSDIIHCYHLGTPVKYTLVGPHGTITEHILGSELGHQQVLQLIVHGGTWKAAELLDGGQDFALLSEVVVPGFEYSDNEIADFEIVRKLFPSSGSRLARFIKGSS